MKILINFINYKIIIFTKKSPKKKKSNCLLNLSGLQHHHHYRPAEVASADADVAQTGAYLEAAEQPQNLKNPGGTNGTPGESLKIPLGTLEGR